jgi:hypothetical protein
MLEGLRFYNVLFKDVSNRKEPHFEVAFLVIHGAFSGLSTLN